MFHTLCTIQGNPVYRDIAPYIAIVVNDAHATVNSIYRGDDAARILHKHGKHTQREIYEEFIHGQEPNPANPPGFSTHELFSDGEAYPHYARGSRLPWWCEGFDVNDADVARCIRAAGHWGWHLFQPYHSGSEFHHLNFASSPKRPVPGSALWRRFWRLRFDLPSS